MIRLADYLIKSLADYGVKHVFLLTGGAAMHINDALGKEKRIEYICNLHEQACGAAAEAYAKMLNELGVAIVTAGPGGTNIITPVAGAWLDSSPCLIISGQVKRNDIKKDPNLRQMGVQEIDIISLVKPITKYAETILDPYSIKYHLEKALYLATHGRKGPVWLDIPLDVQGAIIDHHQLLGYTPDDSPTLTGNDSESFVKKTYELLNNAERPLFLIGNGVRWGNANEEFRILIDTLGLPFATSWLAMDIIEDSHPLLVGRPGTIAPRSANFALQNCDLLISIGARLDMVVTAYAHNKFARAAKKVIIDIDTAELNKFSMEIELKIPLDAKPFLQEMIKQLNTYDNKISGEWVKKCQSWRKRYPIIQDKHKNENNKISLYYFSKVMSDILEQGDVIVPGSSGYAIEIFLFAFQPKKDQRIFMTTGLGPMGFGLPAVIGACIANNNKRTICLDGDGGLQMNIQELETIKRLNLNTKIFIANNGGYASIIGSQKIYFDQIVGADSSSGLTLPDIVKIASAYGIPSKRIDGQSNLKAEIEDILNSDGPFICDMMVLESEQREPRISNKTNPDGSITSMPLEDLFPYLSREEFLANMIIPPLPESLEL